MELKRASAGRYGLFGRRSLAFVVLLVLAFALFADGYRRSDLIIDQSKIISHSLLMKQIDTSDQNRSIYALANLQVSEIFTRDNQRLLYDHNGNLILNKGLHEAYAQGFVYETPNVDFDLTTYREAQKNQTQQMRRLSLDDLIPRPKNPDPSKINLLVYPEYNVVAPIIDTSPEDFFYKKPDGTLDYSRPIDPSKMSAWESTQIPIQIKLRSGVVRLSEEVYPTSVPPGEIGNTYIVGHSSNYSWVPSNYNEVFKPLEKRTKVGQYFIIYDKFGRELRFQVFEVLLIDENNTAEAYKLFDDRRVVTLQTSVLTWQGGVLKPTHRWLTRGELELGI